MKNLRKLVLNFITRRELKATSLARDEVGSAAARTYWADCGHPAGEHQETCAVCARVDVAHSFLSAFVWHVGLGSASDLVREPAVPQLRWSLENLGHFVTYEHPGLSKVALRASAQHSGTVTVHCLLATKAIRPKSGIAPGTAFITSSSATTNKSSEQIPEMHQIKKKEPPFS